MKKIVLAIAMLFALFSAASAIPSGFTKGELLLVLGKQQYSAGENLTASITVFNAEATPIAEAYAVVELVQGNDYYSPSQLSDADNIFFEEKISGINLKPGESKKIIFSYQLPVNLASGSYRIDAYFKDQFSYMVGVPHLFISPKTAFFSVQGNGNWPNLKIVRTKTEFLGQAGPVGLPIEPGATIKGKVFIANTSKEKAANVSLFVGLCDWDDTACKSYNSTKEIAIDSIEANSEKEISVELPAPTIPSAYAIRLEARESSQLVSLYRSRAIVTGGTARVRKLSINNFEFAANETAQIKAVIGPSPDHYTYPTFSNFELKVWVDDLEKGKRVFSSALPIESISIKQVGDNYPEENFSFTTAERLNHFSLCAAIEKGSVFDSQCIEFDSSKFSKPEIEPKVGVEWEYDYAKKALRLEFCNEPQEIELNAEYFLIEKGNSEPIATGSLSGAECAEKIVPAGQSTFELMVTDFNTKRQSKTIIIIEELERAGLAEKKCSELKGRECGSDEQCTAQTIATKDNAKCCLASCEKVVSPDPRPEQPLSNLLIIAIIIIALLLIIGIWVKKR